MKFGDLVIQKPAVCRAPHGARGLKLPLLGILRINICRAPHGARGLK